MITIPCSNPLYAYYHIGDTTKHGKQAYKISHKRIPEYDDNDWYNLILLPCGKCLDCRLSYSREWSLRCMNEASLWPSNYYLTLTYDDENVPKTIVERKVDGNVVDSSLCMTLRKSDLTKFNKKLRQYFSRKGQETPIRFFGCGEYGPNTFRPHMHVIYFNLHLDDLEFLKKNKYGDPIFVSATLNKLWNKGFVTVEEVNENTCGYVARYCLKKQGDEYFNTYENVEREFTLCSRRPGIGRNYFENHKGDIYLTDEIFLNGKKYKPPRYYDKLYEVDNEFALADVKNNRLLKLGIDNASRGIVDEIAYRKEHARQLRKKTQKLLKRTDFAIDKSFEKVYNSIIQKRYLTQIENVSNNKEVKTNEKKPNNEKNL